MNFSSNTLDTAYAIMLLLFGTVFGLALSRFVTLPEHSAIWFMLPVALVLTLVSRAKRMKKEGAAVK